MEGMIILMVKGIANGFVYSLIALGFVMIYKSSRVMNLAQGEMTILGAYVYYGLSVQLGLPPLAAIVGAAIVVAAVGFGVQQFVLRPVLGQSILALVMLTLAVGGLLRGIMQLIWGSNWMSAPQLVSAGEGITIGSGFVSYAHLVFIIVSLALIGVLSAFYQGTKTGLSMRVIADDTVVGACLGINVNRSLAICWALAGIAAGVSGILLSNLIGISYSMIEIGLKAYAIVVIGGLESLGGLIIIGPILGIAEFLGRTYVDPLTGGGFGDLVPWIALMIFLLTMPYGLFGWKRIERV
jgi:branched-chain amino acid transport system permease protein